MLLVEEVKVELEVVKVELAIEGQIGEGWKVVKVKVKLEVVKVEFAVEWLVVK